MEQLNQGPVARMDFLASTMAGADLVATNVFSTMAQDHELALRHLALRFSGNDADARDLVQDAFERALRKRPPVRTRTELRCWLTVVVRNLCISRWRAPDRRSTSFGIEAIPAPAAGEEECPWETITVEVVETALPQLNATLRCVFTLHMEGVSVSGIAGALGISPAQVSVRLFRARQRMRKLLLDSKCSSKPPGHRIDSR